MYNSTIGGRLKTFRKAKNLTGEALGEQLKLGKAGIAHIEAGRQNLSIEQLKQLCLMYPELNLYWLVAGQGTMYNNTPTKQESEFNADNLEEGGVPGYEELLKEYQKLRKSIKNLNLNFSWI